MGEMNAGIFEIAGERFGERSRGACASITCGCATSRWRPAGPITWGLFSRRDDAGHLAARYLDLLEETAAAGGRMFAQVHSRALTVVLSFQTQPALRPAARVEGAARAAARRAAAAAARSRAAPPAGRRRATRARRAPPVGAEAARRRPTTGSSSWTRAEGPHRSVAEIARERGVDPVEAMIDLALERDLERFFLQPIANEDQDHAARADASIRARW